MCTTEKFLSTIKTYTNYLGQGGFGIVLQAIDKSGSQTAVKFLFPTGNYSDREKLRREYNVTKHLHHENIVQIVNVEEKRLTSADIDKIFKDLPSNEKVALVNFNCQQKASSSNTKTIESICIQMELCGHNLRSWLNQKHYPHELHIQIRQTGIVQGMITGLKYLHSHKIIHRDLKPENIFFSRGRYQLSVKIGDFGHSRLIHSDGSRTGPITRNVGTQVYAAPEVSSGEYDYQADLYSLGLIIWEVAQLVEATKRRHLFDTLVNDRIEDLVLDHPIMTGIKQVIINLTKRQTRDRTKSLVDINIEAWEAAIVHEVSRNGCKPLWDAIITKSNTLNWNVQTSHEFKLCLDNARHGWVISLAEGEFPESGFILWENGVKIKGQGAKTILQTDPYSATNYLVVFGNECRVSDVKIINTGFSHACTYAVVLNGSKNKIRNVEITSSSDTAGLNALDAGGGILVNGSQNTVDHVVLNNLQRVGILVERNSNENTISNVTGSGLGRGGIWVCGSKNTISETSLENRNPTHDLQNGVWLFSSGSYNTISHLKCSGYFSEAQAGTHGKWDLVINSANSIVTDSSCGSVSLWGENVTLTTVNCGEFIKVRVTTDGVSLVNCWGKKLKLSKKSKKKITLLDPKFQVFE